MSNGKNSKDIWVLGDLRSGRLFDYGLNLLAGARALVQGRDGRAAMVLIGSSAGDGPSREGALSSAIPLEGAAERALSHGADLVYVIDHPDLAHPRADMQARVLLEAVGDMGPGLILFSLTELGREIAARAARLKGCGLIADCDDLRLEEGRVVASCPAWGGQIMSELTFTDISDTGMATVQPHAFRAIEGRGSPGEVAHLQITPPRAPAGLRLISSNSLAGEHRRLESARTVVVGGAGLGSAEQFGSLRGLAAALEGEVGTTRPPVLEHWVDEDRMVGQTGKTIRPELLITMGTSGAMQYTAGIMESGFIVAVNRDGEAPIFQLADLGVKADLKVFLPLFIARVKEAVLREMADVWSGDGEGLSSSAGFGERLRKLRESHGWPPETLAEKTGQTPEFIEQVERGGLVPPVSFLLGLSRAFEVDPDIFLRSEEKAAILDRRAQAFIKRTRNYFYQTLTPGTESQHLRAFMVTVEPRQTHKPVAYKHEGEEFLYVMEGSLELTLGSRPHILKEGEYMHYNSEITHRLKSLESERDTRCLVVLYIP